MPYIETNDHTTLYYRDWGTGKPVVFVSSWSFSGAMWEYQMLALAEKGLRCIALDRRGHGRSDDPGHGYDFDMLADDLAALLTRLDLHDVTLVGHSMGCNEIARYLSRHGTARVARVVLISTVTPFVQRTEDNPEGVPKIALERTTEVLLQDRPRYFSDGAITFFGLGSTWPQPTSISPEMVQWVLQQSLESSLRAIIGCQQSLWETDMRPDMHAFTLPTLLIHGDRDLSAPLNSCGRRTAQAIASSELLVYEGAWHGLPFTHKDRLNADLLTFIEG